MALGEDIQSWHVYGPIITIFPFTYAQYVPCGLLWNSAGKILGSHWCIAVLRITCNGNWVLLLSACECISLLNAASGLWWAELTKK